LMKCFLSGNRPQVDIVGMSGHGVTSKRTRAQGKTQMNRKAHWLAAIAALGLITAGLGSAALAQAPAAVDVKPGVLEPEAVAALDRMGAHLRSFPTFRLVSTATTEQVYDNGQKLQFLQRTTYTRGGLDKLHVKIETDSQNRDVFYNGKTFTIVAPRAGKYLQLPATGGVGEVLTRAYEDWGIEFPVQDLFRWGDPSATAERPKEGFKVGTARIGDAVTDHYAFRQTGVDWQIWIDQGDKPLPRKMVITNLEDAAQPQYVAYFGWETSPKIAADTFDFTPAKTDARIDLSQFAAAAK
jgi:hypothetical protein